MVTLKVCTSQNGRNDCTFDEVITYIKTILLQLILIDTGFCSAYHPSSISKKGTYALFTFASTPCDNFVYVFPYDCSCIADGYEKRRMCLHCLQLSCELYVNYWGTDRNKSVRRLNANPYGDWMQIRTEIERKSYGAYAASMQRLSGDNTIYFDKKSTENRTFAARSSRELR